MRYPAPGRGGRREAVGSAGAAASRPGRATGRRRRRRAPAPGGSGPEPGAADRGPDRRHRPLAAAPARPQRFADPAHGSGRPDRQGWRSAARRLERAGGQLGADLEGRDPGRRAAGARHGAELPRRRRSADPARQARGRPARRSQGLGQRAAAGAGAALAAGRQSRPVGARPAAGPDRGVRRRRQRGEGERRGGAQRNPPPPASCPASTRSS